MLLHLVKNSSFVVLFCVEIISMFKFCSFQTQFLIQECASLITKPNFISTLSYAIDNPLHYQKVCVLVEKDPPVFPSCFSYFIFFFYG